MAVTDFLSRIIGSAFKEKLSDFISLDSVEDERTFVLSDGSLMTLLEIDGSRIALAPEDLEKVIERLRPQMATYLSAPGHALQFCFLRDPKEARSDISRLIGRTRRISERLGIDVEDILSERERHLADGLIMEMNLLAIYTSPAVMSSDESKDNSRELAARLKGTPPMLGAQIGGKAFTGVHMRHNSMVDAIVRDFDAVGQAVRSLDCTEALRKIRGVIYPDKLVNRGDWTPRIMGQKAKRSSNHKTMKSSAMPETTEQMTGKDFSYLGDPLLSRQVASEDSWVVDPYIVRMGNNLVSGFDVTLAPEILSPFDELIRQASGAPGLLRWRASFLIESGGLQGDTFKKLFANVFTFLAQQNNSRIRDVFKDLVEMNGVTDTIVRLRMSFAAWADIGEEDQLRSAVATLRRSVERWGNAQTDALVGDPLACVASTIPGVGVASTAPVAAAPLTDALALLPLSRAASPWSEGGLALSSPDGKLWPYQPGSSLQTTWCDILVGTPGSGKSVLMNAINLASALSPQTATTSTGQMLLPRIAIIDVGISSSGLISLLQDALPTNRRHEAMYACLKNTRAFAINPFDTQPGLRFPLNAERQFLINFLGILCTPSDAEATYDGMGGLIGATVTELYRRFSDDESPRLYLRQESLEVDNALKALNIEPDEATTWWEIVDALIESDRMHDAVLAQRYATPTLGDLITAVQSEKIHDLYGELTVPTGETIIRAFQRMISAAISEFPIISHPTRFDLANARVAALDLNEVTARGIGPAAHRQTALMFMIARQALCRDWFLDEAEIKSLSLALTIEALHVERAKNNKQLPKRLCMDEFHRTGGFEGIRAQVVQDLREGRKHNVQVALASQLLTDFDESITSLATSVWICNASSEAVREHAMKTFGLNQAASQVLRYQLNGPTSRGAPVFGIFKLKTGEVRQLLVSKLGPIELWAFSTTSEDVALRSRLYEMLGPKVARQALARRFPGGSAMGEVDRRKARLEDEGARIDNAAEDGIVESLAQEIAEQAWKFLLEVAA